MKKLIIDHDAGVDDLAAIALALLSGRFDVRAITITPADSYPASATQTTLALLKFLNRSNIKVALGSFEGKNLFPSKWRDDSLRLSEIEELKLPTLEFEKYGLVKTSAPELLTQLLEKDAYEFLVTGPLTNIAEAIKLKPSLAKNIQKITFMGGAFEVHGNVEKEGHDLSAEWNVYNNPEALDVVLKAGVPIQFVSLDATNVAPVTKTFMQALKSQSDYQVSSLFMKVWSVIASQIENEHYQQTYFFWDTLTAAILCEPTLAEVKEIKLEVILTGMSEGRTKLVPQGMPASMSVNPKQIPLENFILKLFKS